MRLGFSIAVRGKKVIGGRAEPWEYGGTRKNETRLRA